jgi:hypothetical protein
MTGSLTPHTYPSETITVRCNECGREGRYRRDTLLDKFGPDMAMPDILNSVTEDCDKNARLSTDRCKAIYGELSR